MNDILAMLLDGVVMKDDPEKNRDKILKQPFAWPGGKSRSLPYILPHLPVRERYVEPFGGSGIVLLNRERSLCDVYNDRFGGVVDFYRCIQNDELLEQLKERLDLMINSRELFLECKDTWEQETDMIVRASKWYYMVLMSFSGQGRHYGRDLVKSKSKVHAHIPMFGPVHDRLRDVVIENQDYWRLMQDTDSHQTVFYLDPPYMPTTSAGCMYKHGMTVEDHVQLCERIWSLDGFVALSGYENVVYDRYPWSRVEKYDIMISMTPGRGDENNNKKDANLSRQKRTEYLYIKE